MNFQGCTSDGMSKKKKKEEGKCFEVHCCHPNTKTKK
jgi:hypothetical protein